MSGVMRRLTGSWRRPRSLIIAAAIAIFLAGGLVAWAAWSSQGNGPGAAKSLSMPGGNTPTASVSGTTVAVTWSASVFANGVAVQGYRIRRYAEGSTTAITPGADCSGTITALTCAENAVPGGSWQYTVTPYQGNWIGAESGKSPPVTVSTGGPIATATTVHSSGMPSVFGQLVTFTATVSPAPPAGETVSFADGATSLGSGVLNTSGSAAVSTGALTVGSHTISASYAGDSSFVGSSGSTVQVVNKAGTTLAVTSSDNSAVFGESVSFAATVTAVAPGAGTADGTVQFEVDGVNFGAAVSLTGGSATSDATNTLAVGSHTVTAVYSGSTNFNGATGTLSQAIGKANTTTALTSAPNPSVFGQMVTFTATVSAVAPGAGTLGGTSVTFTDGTTTLGTASLSGGTATFITSALSVGSHTIGASYAGDPNVNGSTAPPITQIVGKADTTTVVTSSANPSAFGQGVIFTATIAAVPPGAGSPNGTVQFHIDGSNFGSPVALLGGKAFSDSATALSVGPHTVTATYSGNGNLNGSTSAGLTQTVTQASSTTTVTASSANPSVFGQAVTFTATVSAMPPGAGTPTGTVQFFVGGVNLGSAVALIGGTANSPAISSLPVGTSAISASYGGDTNFTGSVSPSFTQTVNKDATTTAVTSSANPSVFGQSVTFTATVSANTPGSGTPTGTVTFSDGTTILGAGALSGGSATFSTSTLSVGNHSITASYGGNGNFLSSASSALQQVGNQAPTTTTLSSSSNPTVYGQPVTFTASVTANAPGSGTATGSVTFTDGFNTLGSGTLSGGTATLQTSAMAVASHTITATYNGDGNFATSSTTLTQTVNRADSMTTLSASPTSAVSGQIITFTPTTTAVAPGAGTPSGLWWLWDGSTVITGGSVNFALNIGLPVGTHSLTAHWDGDGNFNGSISSPVVVTVTQASSTTTVTASSANPSVFGQSVTFTATVSAMAPGGGTPTGTVQFFVGGVNLGSAVTLIGGTANSPAISSLPVGTSAISASYSGDVNFTGSGSPSFTQTLNKDATTTAVVSSANPSLFGQSVTFTATVSANSPGAGTPSGTVTFSEGATTLGTGTLSSGSASFATSTLSVGNHTISASYGGDGNFLTSAGSVLQAVGNQVPTTTIVNSNSNPSVWGQPVTFTATVTVNAPGSGTPTGNVTFMDGTTTMGSGTLNGSGTATFVTADLSTATTALPTHTITATYSGDGNFATSNAALSQTVNRADTTTSFSADMTSALVGQTVTFTATVSVVAPGAGTPSGVWYLYDGATAIAGGSILGTISTASLSPGVHSMTAHYNGDGNFATSVSPSVTVTVTQPTTSTTLASAPNPSVFGQSVSFTATVAVPPPGGGTPTGTVTFSEGTTSLGTRTVDSTGKATLSTSSLRVGVLSITATYSGDSNFTVSISAPLTQTINKADSATALISTQNPSAVGQGVTFIATVTVVAPGAGTPGGPIWFFDGSNLVDTELLDANGQAAFGTSSLTAGTHTITANYLGADPHFNASSGSVVQIVNQGITNTTTAVVSSANPSLLNDSVTFTATVSPAPPTGETVTFVDGTTTLGTGTLSSAGVASFTTTSPLGLGSHTINAVYGGDATLLSSTGTLTQQVVRIIISPAIVVSYSTVTIRGAGWPANQSFIAIYIGPLSGYGFLCYATADVSGAFSQSCTVNGNLAQGTYLATATLDFVHPDTGNLVTVNPVMTYVSPTYANPNNTVTINGSGFAASSNITVTLGGVQVTASVGSTNYLGQANNITFTVPSGTLAGATTITVTDSASPANSASIAFTVYNATIAISPTTVASNASVTVSGTGWPANETNILVYIGPLNGYGFACYANADATGAFSQSCPVSTNLAQGTYLATATDNSIITTGNQVTVNPAITYLNPTYANPTNTITVNGSGFAASSNLTVTLGSVQVTPSVTTTNYLGGLGYLTFNVPSGAAAGATTITVTDSASPPNSASIAFTVYNASIAISPTTAASGTSVTVSGSGWPANESYIRVYIGPLSPGYGFLCYAFADAVGAFSQSCTVNQALAQGTYTALATDNSSTATGNAVTVTPAITYLAPLYANPTNTVTINGSGFAATSNITVALGGAAVTASVSTTNYLGGLGYLTFNVPSGTPAGATTITVTDSASPANSASIAFTVYNATIAISPTTVASNASVTVSGTGWPANETNVLVYIGPLSPGYGFLCYATADATGTFSKTCTVSTSLAQGTYTATATDNSITVTGNAVTVTPAITYLNPTYANPTNTITVNGSGFAATSNLTVTLGSVQVTPSITATNYLGGLGYLTFTVPSATPSGATTITVTDSASPSNSASIAFTVYSASIAISPTTVASAGSVSVSGSGWPANETYIQVYIGPLNPGYGYLCAVAADGVGAFSQSCPATPNLAQGTYLATATDGAITATGNAVTVTPAITYLAPLYANPTNTVTINGSGFAATSNITVTLGSVAVTASVSTTNYLGGLGYLTFDVPSGTAAGATIITATDSGSPPNSASIAFTVYNATIAVSPTTAAANSMVTVTGTGWPANDNGIQVYLGAVGGNGFLCSVGADASGAISKSCPVSPYLAQGTYLATASDYSITTTGNQVTVTPVISYVSPTYANPTNQVTVVGFTFAASSSLTVKLGTVVVTPSVSSSDPLGRVNFTFNVPSGTAARATTITVTDSALPANSASIAFTVYNATISLSPTTVSRGGSVTVSGSGWHSFNGAGVGVYIGSVSPGYGFLCYVFPDASGVIAATSCIVPNSTPTGTSDVLATDGSITATGNQVTVS